MNRPDEAEPPSKLRRPARAAGPILLAVLAACGGGEGEEPADPPLEGVVAAGSPEAAQVGLQILALGGNAVDAAVATALAQGVTEPGNAGLGGWGVAVVRVPGRDPVVVDVPVDASGEAGVAPATLAALLDHLWRTYGSGDVTWAELVEPAESLAREGFSFGRYAHRTLVREYSRLYADSAAAALTLTPDRAIHAEASRVTNPELAATLRILGQEGAAAFYEGEISRRAASVLTAREVEGRPFAPPPTPREREALSTTFRQWRVWVPPEPYGGPELLRALELLERAPPRTWAAPSPVRVAWLAEALAHAFGPAQGVAAHLASVPELPVPPVPAAASVDTGTGRLPTARRTPGAGGSGPQSNGWTTARQEGGETTHLSVVDAEGTVVALTQTLGEPYGAGWPVDGLGFFPGRTPTSMEVITGRSDTASAPVSRVETRRWLAPTVVTRGDSAWMALGSPGGRPGISALVQVLGSWLSGADSLAQAVAAPRVHVARDGQYRGRLYLEGLVSLAGDTLGLRQIPAVWGDSVAPLARTRGFRVGERDTGLLRDGRDPWFGAVDAVGRIGAEWVLVADPRRDGVAVRLEGGMAPRPRPFTPSEEEEGRELLLPEG